MHELLEVWRKAKHPSTSALIVQIAAKSPIALPSLPAQERQAMRTWLLETQRESPMHLGARLAQLEARAPSIQPGQLWPVFEALSRWPADPRIATSAVRCLIGPIRVRLTDKLIRRLLSCVETHGDESHFRALEQLLDLRPLDDGLQVRAIRVLKQGLASRPTGPELNAIERASLLARDWTASVAKASSVDLLAAVYESPHDDSCKLVLADALLERGDPRGEFISLQLGQAQPKRQQTLLNKHRKAWLGGLAPIVDNSDFKPVFEKGFVSELSVKPLQLGQFQLAALAPEWATVRRVREGLLRLSSTMRSLEHAGLVPLELLRAWGRDGLTQIPLKSLRVRGEPAMVATALESAPSPIPWLGLHLDAYQPSRQLRDVLVRVSGLSPFERLRLGARVTDVMPVLLREMKLDWVPSTLEELTLLIGHNRAIVLSREARGWALTALDYDSDPRTMFQWDSALLEFRWLAPTQVRLKFSKQVDEKRVESFEAVLRRLGPPVGVTFDAAPLGW